MVTFNVTDKSHLDHAMTAAQREFALTAIREGRATVKVGSVSGETVGFAILAVELPASLGTVPCALLGPETGGAPISDAEAFTATRNGRPNTSRLTRKPPVPSSFLTAVIVGGNLATIYGGPLAPQEPGDPYLAPEGKAASEDFWSKHALSAEAFGL